MAGEKQHLVALRRIEEHPFHLLHALVIAVHQCIVQDDQGRPAGLLEQVGIGQPADHPHLLAGAETQAAHRPGLRPLGADARQPAGRQVLADVQAGLGKQQLQVAVHVPLQRGLQPARQFAPPGLQQAQQKLQRLGAQTHFSAAAHRRLGTDGLFCAVLLQPLRAGFLEFSLQQGQADLPLGERALRLVSAAPEPLHVLRQDIGSGPVHVVLPGPRALLQGLALGARQQQQLTQRSLALPPCRVIQHGLEGVVLPACSVAPGLRRARRLPGLDGLLHDLTQVRACGPLQRAGLRQGFGQPAHRRRRQLGQLVVGFTAACRELGEFAAQRVEPHRREVCQCLVPMHDVLDRLLAGRETGLGRTEVGHAKALQQGSLRGTLERLLARQVAQVGATGNDLQVSIRAELQVGGGRDKLFACSRQAQSAQRDVAARCDVETHPRGGRLLSDLQLGNPGVLLAQPHHVGLGNFGRRRALAQCVQLLLLG